MSDQPASVDELHPLGEQPAQQDRPAAEQQQAAEEYAKTTQLSMHLKVHSPTKVYFDGPAFSLTAENATGVFDVLPHHHNFISLLLPCTMIIRSVKEGERKIQISGGLLHVKADKAIVFLDI